MLIRHKKGWELRESEVTPEAVFHRRRDLLKAVAARSILAPGLFSSFARAAGEETSAGLYPAKQNPRYVLDRPLTDEKLATSYNNFYEFVQRPGLERGHFLVERSEGRSARVNKQSAGRGEQELLSKAR